MTVISLEACDHSAFRHVRERTCLSSTSRTGHCLVGDCAAMERADYGLESGEPAPTPRVVAAPEAGVAIGLDGI